LIIGLLTSFIGSLLLLLSPWWVSNALERLPELATSALAVGALLVLCFGLWTHAGWTWWLLVISSYTLVVLGLVFGWSEIDPFYRLRNSVKGLFCLVILVWYFQFKPSVVEYYAAIRARRHPQRSRSGRDAA
jgi:hypothetical protein